MILDATAGNRTMWQTKNTDNIIYIDMEKRLEVKPTIFCNNEQTPFKDSSFDTIFYDPPHTFGIYNRYHARPSFALQKEVCPKLTHIAPYYGWDKYATKHKLVRHIYNAQMEFKRILKDDGLLLVKWNVMSISIHRLLSIFSNWNELMRLFISDPTQTAGEHQTYWIILTKKIEKISQQPLDMF